jgi:uncharacterized Rmd1/YagE family protein
VHRLAASHFSLAEQPSALKSTISAHKKRNTIRRLISRPEAVEVQSAKVETRPLRVFPVLAACTADSYDFSRLLPVLQKRFRLSPFICDEVLHVQVPSNSEFPSGEVFFFKHGAFVFWATEGEAKPDLDAASAIREAMVPFLKTFEIAPYSDIDVEELEYRLNHLANSTSIADDEVICLPSNLDSLSLIKDKLAFSNGLADSVKLGVLEQQLDAHIAKVRSVPMAMQNGKKIPLSRPQVLRLLGELLHFRAQLNLNSDLLDTPDLYWSEPRLEELYIKMSRLLETRRRTAILNKKLDYAKEMAQMLNDHLSEQHGLKLEWGIIALIAIEVAFESFHLLEAFL